MRRWMRILSRCIRAATGFGDSQAMNINTIRIVLVLGLLHAGTMLLCPAPAAAQPGTDTTILVQDFKAFAQRCPGPPASYSPSCANEMAGLKARQLELHLTDVDLAKATLVYDFNDFYKRCPSPPSSYSQTCTNLWAELKSRQQELGLTDGDLKALGVVVTRGFPR